MNVFERKENFALPEYKQSCDDVWNTHLQMSREHYLEIHGISSLSEDETRNAEKYLIDNEHIFERESLDKEKLVEYDIEEDPAFFEFLVTTARDFKNYLLELNPSPDNPNFRYLCFKVSVPLTDLINEKIAKMFPDSDAKAILISGSFGGVFGNHHWVQVGTTRIDITPEQFKNDQTKDPQVIEAIKNNTTEEGVFVSNNKNNVLYSMYKPILLYNISV